MNPSDNLEESIRRLQHPADAFTVNRIRSSVLQVLDEMNSQPADEIHPPKLIWGQIIKTRLFRYAAAAVLMMAVLAGIATLLHQTSATAYAIEQTLEANNTIQTIYLRRWQGEENIANNEYAECWVVYDQAGLVSNFRMDCHGDVQKDNGNLRSTVWNEGVSTTWMPLKNTVIVLRMNNMEEYWQNFAKDYDPKLIFQRIYEEAGKNEAIQLTIHQPARKGASIGVEALYTRDGILLELMVDPITKLVTQLSRYRVEEQQEILIQSIEFLAYNQPVDPSVFELNEISDDAHIYDQVDRLVGLEQGDLTDEEIAVEVVRQSLEATIAQDYEEVSRLMEGDPGDTIETFIKEELWSKLVRVISLGQPERKEKWPNILCVPCEIEVEDENGARKIVTIIATAKAIGYQPGCRWIADTDLEVDAPDRIVKGAIVPGVGVGDYTFDMSANDVIEWRGKPKAIFYGQERYTLDRLPKRYYMVFRDLTFLFVDGLIQEISVHDPGYKFANGLGVDDLEQDIKQAFGNDFHLTESEWKDILTYKDKGVRFEIHKESKKVMEISIFRANFNSD